MKIDLRKTLLAGTALVAVGAFGTQAQAADQALGAVGGDTALTAGAANTIVERASAADTDTGEFDASGGVTFGGAAVKAIDLDTNSGTIFIFDGTDAGGDNAAEDTATFDGDVSIVSGKTLTITLGDDEDSGTGAVSVGLDISDGTNTDIFVAGSSATTRGGNLTINQASNAVNEGTSAVTIDAVMKLTTLTLQAGAATANVGATQTTVLGDEAADTIDVTGLVNTAGAATTTVAGGAATTTVTGTLTVGSGGIDINGGAGATSGAGGASKVTVTPAVATLTGNTTIDGGAAGTTTGAGGAAELELTAGLTGGTGNFTVTGGVGATGAGTANGGVATLDSDAAFTTTGTLTFVGGAGGSGSVAAADGGASNGEFAASLSALGVTVTGGAGGSNEANVGGAATVATTTTSTIGASGLTVTGGAGGSFAGASVGGAASYTSTTAATVAGATTITGGAGGTGGGAAVGGAASATFTTTAALSGNVSVTGGAGNDHDSADGGAASATFTGAVTATGKTLTITGGAGDDDTNGDGGAALVTFQDAATFSSIVLDNGADNNATGGAASLDVTHTAAAANKTITGTITAAADGEGTITLENTASTFTTTFANKIGTTAKRIGALVIGNGTDGGTAAFSGEVHADAITISGADDDSIGTFNENVSVDTASTISITDGGAAKSADAVFKKNLTGGEVVFEDSAGSDSKVTFSGTAAQTVTSMFSGAGANEGQIIIGDGTNASNVTFSGIIGTGSTTGNDVGAINIKTLSTAAFNANTTSDGALTLAGKLRVGTGATFTSASLTDSGGTITVDVLDTNGTLAAADFGLIDLGGAATVDTDDVTINVTGFLGTGTADILVNAGDAFDEAKAVTDNSALYTFTAATNGTLTVARAATTAYTNSSSNLNVANALIGLGGGQTGGLKSVQNAFSAADTATVNKVLEAVGSPNTDGGAVVAGLSVSNAAAGVTNTRLASLRDGTAGQTGMVAGNMAQGLQTWIQAFGQTGTQDERDGISGFDTDTIGVAVGIDTETLAEDWVWGLGFSYASTEVDSDGLANAKTDIDSYQLTLYADYDLDDRTYVSGQLGYAWNNNDTTRNPGGVATLTANGDFDSDQVIARLEAGRDYDAGNGATVTPSVLVNYMNYSADNYTETGAGGASLAVDSDNLNVLELGLGVEGSWIYEQADGGYLKPTLHAGVRYDVIGDKVESTNTFTGGGASFKTEGFDPAETTLNVGAGVTYFSTTNWELSAAYDFEYKSDYDAHSGTLKAAYKF